MRINPSLKKRITVFLLSGSLLISNSLYAAESSAAMEAYLKNIQDYTLRILNTVNKIPIYLANVSLMAQSFLKPDDSDATAQMQNDFITVGSLFANNFNPMNNPNLQLQFTASLLGLPDTSQFSNPATKPAILTTVPNINDLSYITFLGSPPVKKGAPAPSGPNASSAYNYVLNVGGLNIRHAILPTATTGGDPQSISLYRTYYNTVMSIQSFNAYIWSSLYNEQQNSGALTTAQSSLVQQASQPSWFVQIASEELGKVLRQILMFQSQTYVLMTQLIQTQKQLLMAQTMTNSLLILNNQVNESILYNRALGAG